MGCPRCRGWLLKVGEEIGIAVGRAFTAFQDVRIGELGFQPALDAGVVFANLGDVDERFVVREDTELGRPKVAAETLDGPNDADSFQVELYS